jgi:hypothetical protein
LVRWKFWEKPVAANTVISVQAFEGGVQQIFVEAQDPRTALDVWVKVRRELVKREAKA